jgi:uncharacterized protein (TIGR03067 family)
MIFRIPPVVFLFACLYVAACSRMVSSDAPRDRQVRPTQPLTGVWLPEADYDNDNGTLGYIRRSKFTITGQRFAISNYWGLTKDVTGTFTLDPTANPPRLDITNDEIDCTPIGEPVQYPAGTWPGIYKLDGDVLTVCFQMGSHPQRPADFHLVDASATDGYTEVLTLVRADADFKDYPQVVNLAVIDPQGHPVLGARVFRFLNHMSPSENPRSDSPGWRYDDVLQADARGCTTMPYDDFSTAGVRDTERKLIGFTTASPAQLQKGTATIQLEPECLLHGTVVCKQLAERGKPLGSSSVYLGVNGERIALYVSPSGQFEFPVPPGTYSLYVYGENLQRKRVEIKIPPGRDEFEVPPIDMDPLRWVLLQGQPAPELAGDIVGWKGHPVRLADLRGKYVLLDFWGYWCGPCVAEMPMLMELHDRFAGRGLAIVTVHVGLEGDVDSPAKLDEKIASVKASLWGGRDLPFPTALSAGRMTADGYNGLIAAQYGVQGYPTKVLIDRQGKVVGAFDAADFESAAAEIEKLLAQKQ